MNQQRAQIGIGGSFVKLYWILRTFVPLQKVKNILLFNRKWQSETSVLNDISGVGWEMETFLQEQDPVSIWSLQKLQLLKILDLGTARALQKEILNSSSFGPFDFACLLTSLHAPQQCQIILYCRWYPCWNSDFFWWASQWANVKIPP